MNISKHIEEAIRILVALGFPEAQQNQRSAICLLALLNLSPEKGWSQAENPLRGITPIIEWARENYKIRYAPNTRASLRKLTMHQFVKSGIAVYNPDDPLRPVNSPKAVYQIEASALRLFRTYSSDGWREQLGSYLISRQTISETYESQREQNRIPLRLAPGKSVSLSPGAHNELIKKIVEDLCPRFAPGGELVYVGDTEDKFGYFDPGLLRDLGIRVDPHGKLPDVVTYFREKNWLLSIESVTSHGPVDGKRHAELTSLFAGSSAGLVFITAFDTKRTMTKYLKETAWETEVWLADSPSHLIHFNGERFLGPH
jgi:hypothetical protein